MRGSVVRLGLQYAEVDGDGFVVGTGMLFQSDSASEQVGGGIDAQDGSDLGGYNRADRFKLHHELPHDGLNRASCMAKSNSIAHTEYAGFDKRVLHAGYLLLHRDQRFAND